jgi:hypothetical protein
LYDYRYVITWEWWFAGVLTLYWIGSVPLQLYWALHERQARLKVTAISNTSSERRASRDDMTHIEVALRDDRVFEQFEKFAEMNFCTESVRFISDVWAWKSAYPNRSERWRSVKAQAIITTYVMAGSVLQVNVDGPRRERVERNWKDIKDSNKEVPIALFDEMEREIMSVLRWNLWRKFLNSGALDKILSTKTSPQMSSNKSSTVMVSSVLDRNGGSNHSGGGQGGGGGGNKREAGSSR